MLKNLQLQILFWWNHKPLFLIMLIAAILRLLSAIFSKGYGMHDDHFLVIEVAQKWIEGIPHWFNLGEPSLHSLFYPGFHYLLFSFLEFFGMDDPQNKMYVVRILHAAYSMSIPYFGYKIALFLGDRKAARNVGIILAAWWYLPFLSVRNLREITCIPPLMAGYYYLLKANGCLNFKRNLIYAGALFGLAFTFRYQTVFFPVAVGLVFLFRKNIIGLFYFAFSFLVFITLTQGLIDLIAWGYPFASLHAYYLYNKAHANDFITAPWYQYLLTILGFLGPPACLIFIWGYIKTWRRAPEIFFGVALFLFFHSLFPNKQERFVFPLFPFFILLGVIGWNEYVKRSSFWSRNYRFHKAIWIYFWIINLLALGFQSFTYSKRSRVETMYFLGNQPDFRSVVLETYRPQVPFPPLYYLDKWRSPYEFNSTSSLRRLNRDIKRVGRVSPNYIAFYGDVNLDSRVARLKKLFPEIKYMTTIEWSLVDAILFKVNPKYQANEKVYIYKILY